MDEKSRMTRDRLDTWQRGLDAFDAVPIILVASSGSGVLVCTPAGPARDPEIVKAFLRKILELVGETPFRLTFSSNADLPAVETLAAHEHDVTQAARYFRRYGIAQETSAWFNLRDTVDALEEWLEHPPIG